MPFGAWGGRAKSRDGTAPSYVTTSSATYDAHGRALTATDALNRTTTTSYTPALGGPVTGLTVTNPLSHTMSTTLSPTRGQPLTVTDVNGKTTTGTYDPLGRLTKVWLPGRAELMAASCPITTVGRSARWHVA